MFITIPSWDVLVDEFGLDCDGDIGTDLVLYWTKDAEKSLLPDRRVEVNNTPDKDGDYIIKATSPLATSLNWIFQDFYTFCTKHNLEHAFGTSKFLRRPYATNRRDR